MKKIITTIGLALALASVSLAQNWGYTTPRFGGGYNYYDSNGNSGYSTPRFGGGYNYYQNGR